MGTPYEDIVQENTDILEAGAEGMREAHIRRLQENSTDLLESNKQLLEDNGELIAANIELLDAVQGLATAIRNHRLNSVIYTPVDKRLWVAADELVTYNESS